MWNAWVFVYVCARTGVRGRVCVRARAPAHKRAQSACDTHENYFLAPELLSLSLSLSLSLLPSLSLLLSLLLSLWLSLALCMCAGVKKIGDARNVAGGEAADTRVRAHASFETCSFRPH